MRRINKDKRAVSLVLSYVLLVLVAFAIGTMVYTWLMNKPPIEGVKCNPGVSFTLNQVECDATAQEITLRINNKGRFDVHGFSVKGSESLDVRPWVNLNPDVQFHTGIDGMNILITQLGTETSGLYVFNYIDIGLTGNPVSISVQAIRNQTDEETGEEIILMCPETLITQEVSC